MHWINLTDMQQLAALTQLSNTRPQVIFKHSYRCSISKMALSRLERKEQPEATDFYFLDLIKFRSLSDKIASDFEICHESPQILLIKNTACVYAESHSSIAMEDITDYLLSN